jgi:hypothetical protein
MATRFSAWTLLAALPLTVGAADEAAVLCAVCEDVRLVVEVMEATVRQHASAKNPQLLLALGERLGAVCRDHATRPFMVCEATTPRSGEIWQLEVLTRDTLAGQEPHRVSLKLQFAALRPEGVNEFRELAFSDWLPRYLDRCWHSVWRPGPVTKTLSLVQINGHFGASGCVDRVESVDIYIYSSNSPFPSPRVY